MRLNEVLAKVFDCGLLSREEWSQILNEPVERLAGFVAGTALPSPRNLRYIDDVVMRDTRFPQVEFNAVLDHAPWREVVDPVHRPRDWVGLPLRSIALKPMRDSFMESLETLDPADQEAVIFEAAKMMRKRRHEANCKTCQAKAKEGFDTKTSLDNGFDGDERTLQLDEE